MEGLVGCVYKNGGKGGWGELMSDCGCRIADCGLNTISCQTFILDLFHVLGYC